jgi:hypothetical protein
MINGLVLRTVISSDEQRYFFALYLSRGFDLAREAT